eukprot:PITA_33069
MARSMLTFKRLSRTYWAKTIHTTIYLRNRSPTTSLDRITTYEAWFGFKTWVKHLRVFGSVCYALVLKEKQTKLDSRSLKCTTIRYSNEKKGYRLLTNGKFIVSRDVTFDETESKSAEEIEILLQKLETKVVEKNEIHKVNQIHQIESQTTEHQLPKWVVQLLKDLKPDEQNKTGTRKSHRSEGNFSLTAHDFTEPSTYKEAVKHKEWQQAMIEEYREIINNSTWKLVDRPQNVKPIGCKWVYRIKYNQKGELETYKARLVTKGFAQQEGIDYEEMFAPIAKWNTIQLTLALTP